MINPTMTQRKRSLSSVSSPTGSPASKRTRSSSVLSYPSSSLNQIFEDVNLSDSSESFQIIETIKLKKVLCQGPMYLALKPKSVNSLFSHIIRNCPDLENTISGWIYMYKNNPNAAMDILISLFLDVMGYHNIDVNFNENFKFPDLRNKLEQKCTKIQKKLICVFRNTSRFAKTSGMACFAFLQDLIRACEKENILYDIIKILHNFILEMCMSKNRIIIITICSMSMRILSILLQIEKTFEGKKITEKKQKRDINNLKEVINNLKSVLLRYSTISDAKLSMLRQRSAEEFLLWITMSDDMKFHSDVISKLRRLIVDHESHVRITALTTCCKIVENGYLNTFIEEYDSNFKKLCAAIIGRLNDINFRVEIMAIKFFTILSRKYDVGEDYVTVDVQRIILEKLYSQIFMVAKASVLFLASFVNEEHILKVILDLAKKFEEGDNMVLLIHAILGSLPILLKLHEIFDLLMKDDTSSNNKKYLLKMVYYYINIVNKGELGYQRDEVETGIDIHKMNNYIGEVVIKNIMDLFMAINEDDSSMEWILKILNLIDLMNPTLIQCFRGEMKYIVKFLTQYMNVCLNSSILSLISQIFNKLTEEELPFGEQYSISFANYLEKLIEEYKSNVYLSKQEAIISEELYREIRKGIFRLAVITEHHNLVQKLDWNNIYSEWENGTVTEEVKRYQMKCCKNYLKWEVLNLIEVTDDNKFRVPILKDHINLFLNSCGAVIAELNRLSTMAFLYTCDFLLEYNKIKMQPRSKTLYDMLNISIQESLITKFDNFILKFAFKEMDASLTTRKTFLCRYLSLIMNGVLPVEKTFLILKFYHTFKNEYNCVYDFIFSTLDRRNKYESAICVIKTLLHLYLTNEQDKLQLALSQCFAEDLSRSKCHIVVKQGLVYIIKHKEHINFIAVLIPFTKKFTKVEKGPMLEYIYEKYSDFFENEAFSLFLNELKPKNESIIASAVGTRRSSIRSAKSNCSYAEYSDDDDDDLTIEEVED